MKTQNLFQGFLATLVLAVASPAQSVLSYDSTFLIPLLTATPGSATQILQLQGFDSSLGTLTEVKVTFDGFVRQRAQGEFFNNQGTGTSDFSYNLTTSFSVDRSGGPDLLDFGPVNLVGTVSLQSLFDGIIDFAGASGYDTTQIDTALSAVYLAPELLFPTYQSPLLIDFLVTATGNSSVSGPGNIISGTTNLVGGKMNVMYTYTPIPEPSTYAAIAGAAVLGFVIRRRRKIAA